LVEECLAVGERRGSKEREEARLFYGCGTSLPDSIVHADAGAAFSALIYSGQLSILISNMCPVFIFFSPTRFGLMLRFGYFADCILYIFFQYLRWMLNSHSLRK
jgi:hypothetical protein